MDAGQPVVLHVAVLTAETVAFLVAAVIGFRTLPGSA